MSHQNGSAGSSTRCHSFPSLLLSRFSTPSCLAISWTHDVHLCDSSNVPPILHRHRFHPSVDFDSVESPLSTYLIGRNSTFPCESIELRRDHIRVYREILVGKPLSQHHEISQTCKFLKICLNPLEYDKLRWVCWPFSFNKIFRVIRLYPEHVWVSIAFPEGKCFIVF